MSRLISTKTPGKIRHHHRRTIAEALRRLAKKPRFDDESKDLAALIVLSLHAIADTVERTINAWEKRDYWVKAERFRQDWRWVEPLTERLSRVIYEEQWDEFPNVLMELMPYFSDIQVKRMTRQPSLWRGAYQTFLYEE
jgi:hypothetical protein